MDRYQLEVVVLTSFFAPNLGFVIAVAKHSYWG